MNNESHCSACDAVVPHGAHHCPGCGLQLTAQANQAVYVEKAAFPLFPVLAIAIVVAILAMEFFPK